MKLSKNSLTAKLYRWFYRGYDMPETLCPYFWQVLIMYICIIPYGIVVFPTFLIKESDSDVRFFGGVILWLAGWIALVAISGPISYLIYGSVTNDSLIEGIQMGSILIWFVALTVGATAGVIYLIQRAKGKNKKLIWSAEEYEWVPNPDYRETLGTVIREFFKAKYNKYCPKIDWKDERK
jgi:hypothetical protein